MSTYKSIVTYPGDGVTTRWSFQFSGGYIAPEHVFVSIDGAEPIPAVLEGTGTIVVEPAVAAGKSITIQRITPVDAPLVDFLNGADVSEGNLDSISRQAVFAAAEAIDRGLRLADTDGLLQLNSQGDRNRANHSGQQPMTSVIGLATALTEKVSIEDLSAPTGAGKVGLPVKGTVADAIHWITPEMFRLPTDPDDDWTAPIQRAIDAAEAAGGAGILLGKFYRVGDLVVDGEHIVFQGMCRSNGLLVKSGTLGVHVKKSWVHFRNMRIWSEGTETDGVGTSGVLYSKGSGSTGHIFNHDLLVQNFSGYGIEVRNTLDCVFESVFFRDCIRGLKFRREGTGAADFSTTVQLTMVYAISCDIGIDLERVRHTRLSHVICEWNRVGMVANLSDFTTNRCYFENNIEKGIDCINSSIIEGDNYYNAGDDGVFRSWPDGVTAAADRYYRRQYKGDTVTKRLGLLSEYATEERFLAAIGTTNNIGLKYGEAVVPSFYGDEDLLDQTAWVGHTATSEFGGWSVHRSGYLISHGSSGIRGLKQSVTLEDGKRYVIELATTNVSGSGTWACQVDGVVVTPGVVFTVGSTGSKLVRAYTSQSGPSENYVNVFRLYEVKQNASLVSKGADSLARPPQQRDVIFMAAPPTTGKWAIREEVLNDFTLTQDYMGWVNTPAGWRGFAPVAV